MKKKDDKIKMKKSKLDKKKKSDKLKYKRMFKNKI
jgi:hypothetical protein